MACKIRANNEKQYMKIKLYADGADLVGIKEMSELAHISGFTTNPTLMRKAGVTDYKSFALDVLKIVPDRPVSFEVFADDFPTMERQAFEIASWGSNVNVKIPVTNTKGEFCGSLVKRLSGSGVKLNITAVMTIDQVEKIVDNLSPDTYAIISVFAGRIADTGVDPVPVMAQAVDAMKSRPKSELIWASPRELLNIFQADSVGCHIITATNDILKKLALVGKNLDAYSLETVEMFYKDAVASNFSIKI
jgi:transaldolase